MRKFIAKKNGLSFAIEIDGDKTRFYGLVSGKSYDNKKDITPDVLPNKQIINEIIDRPTLGDPMSANLQEFVAELEKRYLLLFCL